jgi:hypothetical protein
LKDSRGVVAREVGRSRARARRSFLPRGGGATSGEAKFPPEGKTMLRRARPIRSCLSTIVGMGEQ